MVAKKEDSAKEEKPKKKRGRPKGSKDKKPRKKKVTAKKKSSSKKTVSASKKKEEPKKVEPEKTEETPAPKNAAPLENVMKGGPVDGSVSSDAPIGTDRVMPTGMKIEPAGPPPEDTADDMPKKEDKPPLWSGAALQGDRDLSVPPDVLLQGRKKPQQEVEDILEEPEETEEPERAHSSEFRRPPVKASLYRKLAIGFAVPVLLLVLVVVYVTYARATVTVYPQRDTIDNYEGLVVTVREEPLGTDEIGGEIHEVTVGGERTGSASDSIESEGTACGFVTLVNETSQPYTLVATTRLLTPEEILFRIQDQVAIPANGEITTEACADEPGAEGDIGPSTFRIPGLRADTQEVVYAKSDEAMTGGVIARGVVSQDDITGIEEALREELVNEAKEELGTRIEGTWTGLQFEVDTMNRFVNVAPGEEADRIVVRLTLRVRSVSYDRSGALDIVVEDLKRGLTSDRELISVDGDAAEIDVERADPEELEAALRIRLSGESSVALDSPLFDAEKLKGLDLDAVRLYFEGIDGVERVDVRFRPFWLKRMPQLADHIEFKFEK